MNPSARPDRQRRTDRRLNLAILVSTVVTCCGTTLVVIGLVASWGAHSVQGPVLFLLGLLLGIGGLVGRVTESRKAAEALFSDPRFRTEDRPARH